MSATEREIRTATQGWPAAANLYRLCLDVPPAEPDRAPRRLRWMLFDVGHYREIHSAFQLGAAGGAPGAWPADSLLAVAWLAGADLARATPP